MPTVAQGSLALVTGASGHLGTHLVQTLLESGFRVRATVRSEAKGQYLQSLFPNKPLELAIVPDMSKDGAYDAAVVGVDGVVHNASPVTVDHAGDPQDIIGPAVKGVTGLLASLNSHNPTVKRVVQISSIAAVGIPFSGPVTVTEESWNDADVETCEKEGAAAPSYVKYQASKVAAERAFWAYFKDGKSAFDGATILPALIMGPFQQYTTGGGDLGGSAGMIKAVLSTGLPPTNNAESVYNLVDPRDIARGAILALTKQQAGGNRYILSAGPQWVNDYAKVAAEYFADKFPQAKPNNDPAFGQDLESKAVVLDGSKITRELGLKYTPKLVTIKDTVAALV
ncbi:hypothetical protein Q8F55_007355 [Vanrija albida]|uniref:NAD-dependent epimerase/dehydratase domain-containing protein n=1 Tax=Vanrija albida TaxID=181172 RepID=A0ABR3PTB2_9TREE